MRPYAEHGFDTDEETLAYIAARCEELEGYWGKEFELVGGRVMCYSNHTYFV